MPFIDRDLFWAYGVLRALWHLETKVRRLLLRIEPTLPVLAMLSGEALYWQTALQAAWDRRLLIALHCMVGLVLSMVVFFRLIRPFLRFGRAVLHGGLSEAKQHLHRAWCNPRRGVRWLRLSYGLLLLLLLLSGWELFFQHRGVAPSLMQNWGVWPTLLHLGLRVWLYVLWCWLVWGQFKQWWWRTKAAMQKP